MAITWKDATSYAQGQRGKIAPKTWQADIEGCKILIISDHLYHPEEWVMTCRKLNIDERALCRIDAETIPTVKGIALNLAWEKARALAGEYTSLADALFASEWGAE